MDVSATYLRDIDRLIDLVEKGSYRECDRREVDAIIRELEAETGSHRFRSLRSLFLSGSC
ncbi:MAG: hypothetical protein ACQEQV_02800 [Fibrobacterota bacterium]